MSSTSSSSPASPSVTSQLTAVASSEVDEDWEEWNPREPFSVHMAAGSFAGLCEHALIYPLDTIKTFVQVSAVGGSSFEGGAAIGAAGAAAAASGAGGVDARRARREAVRRGRRAAGEHIKSLVRKQGPSRMFRGVGTM